ncbi:hypothetical protein TWF569_009566 [Orbilia oligospora]|uniref:Uncharacterized protein n=1 Tax=Orbilia oligospora TaxID=2813651 RepID=A0A7C8JL88_ORBOL|nr:hypothetical protein TWF102_005615 [Orbilia oligospora]KAF3117882.1 hypothetical protein TWF103_004546 [Orbilia oligospora]KAF3135948.1 hypothetical protein TWF569_009566 [Orbilia oligospora]
MEDPLANVVPAPASNPFLSLPIDILVEVTKSLRFRDLIALSLSTKGLQYLRPKRPENKRELRCFLRIHRQFLSNEYVPQSQHKSTQRKPQLIPPANCPYCQHRLCPPTCETALFLDSDSGFFFPKHLFPTHLAKFKYGRKYASYIKGLEDSYPSQKRSGQTYFYSTIWCEHHRCPRDMLSKSKYYNPENDLGVPLFLKEYYHWRQTKLVSQEVGIGYWVHDRWKVGYRLPPGVQDPKAIKEDDLIPIHEKFFYDSMCLHCLSELPFDSSPGYWRQAQFLAYRCSCHEDGKISKGSENEKRVLVRQRGRGTCIRINPPAIEHRGCKSCGYVSMKFTRIEAFDFVQKKEDGTSIQNGRAEGYWAYLATECELGLSPAGYRGDEKQRMYPVRPQEDAKFLDIIRGRGYGMIPLSPPRAGIQDLPYKVLRQILGYLAQETDPEDEYIFALRASYCFIKCWYGSEAMARIVQNITEPYYVQAYQLLQYSYTFETRENYILGQKDHKARKLTLEAHRQYFQNHR